MGINITDTVTEEGKDFQKMLEEIAQMEVCVGFQRGKGKKVEQEERGTKKKKKKVDVCDIALWNEFGTEHIPSRPFLRKSVDENKAKIDDMINRTAGMLLSGQPLQRVLNQMGSFQVGLVRKKIVEGSYVPNAASTIRKKHSNQPLIDTGRMRGSVICVIRKRGQE